MLNSSERRDSRCELKGNLASEEMNSILEVYGDNSKCFDLATTWTERKCGRIRTFLQYMAGCYQVMRYEIFYTNSLRPKNFLLLPRSLDYFGPILLIELHSDEVFM